MNKLSIKIVYFLFLEEDKWEDIFYQQINQFIETGLYDQSEIFISACGNEEQISKLLFINYTKFGNKMVMKNLVLENSYEYPGIKTVYEIAQNDDRCLILYLHTKGITSGQHRIRELLSKYTVSDYEKYLRAFNLNSNIDVGCIIPSCHGFAYFNFFWVRSSYVRNYCSKPENISSYMRNDRYTWEMWLGNLNNYSRKPAIHTFSPILGTHTVVNEIGAMDAIRKLHILDMQGEEVSVNAFISQLEAETLTTHF